jgi:sulfatase modifying factor 1
MPQSRASVFNLVWFLLFLGCVGGLVVWGVDAASPGPAGRSTPENVVAPAPGPARARVNRSETPDAPASGVPLPSRGVEAIPARPAAHFAAQSSNFAQPRSEQQDMVRLPGGRFRMGSDASTYQSERPAHEVILRPFWLDRHEVTRAGFAAFVKKTGYRTTAERQGWAPVFNPKTDDWEALPGADWKQPRGANGRAADEDDPVTQVSWEDASEYARWAGKRLPTEAEWEYAARGGLAGASFPWGNELVPGGVYRSNFWQGPFPTHNSGADGFRGPAPVGSYPANGLGLYDMSGNVWEWCSDWFSQSYYKKSSLENPEGPVSGAERVQRGGSWFCSPDAMPGYMVYSRMSAPPAAMYPHLGFRCARDVE